MEKKTIAFLLIILITGYAFATSMATRKQIALKIERKIVHRSNNSDYDCPISAFIEDNILNIDFEESINALSIYIINRNTGETIYNTQMEKSYSLYIDLSEQDYNAQYSIIISAENFMLIKGEFTLN